MPSITVKRVHPDAILPSKAHETDVGYDLTLVSLSNIVLVNGRYPDPQAVMYDTGIAVIPENGYYVEVVPRSSLAKTGYMMANSVGIIDPDYRGTIKIVLVKIDKTAKDIELPFCGFQMIVRKLEQSSLTETTGDLPMTVRGDGGFGSTNVEVPVQQTFTPAQPSRGKNRRGGASSLGDMIE